MTIAPPHHLRRPVTRPLAAAALVVAILTTLGCTSGGPAPSASRLSEPRGSAVGTADLVRAAADRSATAESLTVRTTMTSGGDELMSTVAELAGHGSRASITTDVAGMASFELRLVDDVAYVAMPGLVDEGTWVRMDLAELQSVGGVGDVGGWSLGDADPSRLFDTLRGASSESELIGEESIDGVPTTRYRLTYTDAAPAAAALPGEIEVDTWVDDQGFVRRIRQETPIDPDVDGLAELGGPVVIDVVIGDYGEPVEVEAPPEDQVLDLDEVGGLGGGVFRD